MKRKNSLLATATLAMFITLPGQAQDDRPAHAVQAEMWVVHYTKQLGINEEQQAGMLALFMDAERKATPLREECSNMQRIMDRARLAPDMMEDETTRKMVEHSRGNCADLSLRLAKMMSPVEVRAEALLTEEQAAKLRTLREEGKWTPGTNCCGETASAKVHDHGRPAVIDRSKGCCSWVDVKARDEARDAERRMDPAAREEAEIRRQKEEDRKKEGQAPLRTAPEQPSLNAPK